MTYSTQPVIRRASNPSTDVQAGNAARDDDEDEDQDGGQEEIQLTINKSMILNEIARLGADMVSKIEILKH